MELNKKKIFIFNLLIFCGVFILLTGFLEISLRLMGRTSDNFLKQDPMLGWVHMINKDGWSVTREYRVPVHLNNFGLVGPDTTLEKPADTFRIAFLGDSFTEAFQVEPEVAFPALVEKRRNDLGERTEALNFGVTSYGTLKEGYVLENETIKFHPDLVVLGFFVGNDFSDNVSELLNPEAQFSNWQKLKNDPKLWFRNHSTAYRWFLEKKSRNQFLSDSAPVFAPAIYGPSSIFGQDNSKTVRESFVRAENYLKNIQAIAKEGNVPLLVLILPAREQVHASLRSREDRDLDWEKPHKILKEFLTREHIAYLDLLPYFQSWAKINPSGLAYFKFDGHPNETGHFLIAKGILEYLAKYLDGK